MTVKDARVIALERVLSRRKKLDKTLNAALPVTRAEQASLAADLLAKRAVIAEQHTLLVAQVDKIDAMMSGAAGAFRAEDWLKQVEYQTTLSEQKAGCVSQADHAAHQLSVKEGELAELKTQIVVNRARMQIYQERRDRMCAAIALAAEEAQDEEAIEARRPIAVA